ncbi:MAG: NAD(P)H-dependent oxidoreductase [Alphaproteobacteria bacterium]|nr:NAD(P)H-dependent oxidoreductase [Alphaproteobacteria bacterium]
MKHAIIVAHPNPKSLSCTISAAYAAAVRKLGHTCLERDLYGLDFDPRLKAAELPGPAGPHFAEDVLRERALLKDADVFCFVYPLWFNAPPAILKGYVDRVFGFGFGYEPGPGGTSPLLEGRRLISFTTSGAPEAWVRDTGALTALMALFDAHLAAVCGLTVVDHVHSGGIVPGITSESVDGLIDKVSAAAAHCFGSDAILA